MKENERERERERGRERERRGREKRGKKKKEKNKRREKNFYVHRRHLHRQSANEKRSDGTALKLDFRSPRSIEFTQETVYAYGWPASIAKNFDDYTNRADKPTSSPRNFTSGFPM